MRLAAPGDGNRACYIGAPKLTQDMVISDAAYATLLARGRSQLARRCNAAMVLDFETGDVTPKGEFRFS